MLENEISEIIIGKALKIHKVLGPGLLHQKAMPDLLTQSLGTLGIPQGGQSPSPLGVESVYEEILCYELNNSNLICDKQVELPVF